MKLGGNAMESNVVRNRILAGVSVLGVMSTLIPLSAAAAAETVSNTREDEIVVTARRREESSIEVPIAVTAIDGQKLRDAGITEIRDIVAQVPNAVIQDNPESFNVFVNIRGMRIVDVQAEPNVGLYRNGLYVGGHRANLGAQVDIDRVEVLRGPQGGYYGRSSIGGTVDVIYATPKSEFGGYAKATVGSYELTKVEGAINVPVNDAMALRVTGWAFNQNESELFNETLNEHVGAYTDRGVRVGYAVNLGKLSVVWTVEKQHATGPSIKTYAPFGISNFGPVSTPETPERIRRDTRSNATKDQLYLAQAIKFDAGGSELSLNASYKKYEFDSIQDSDQTAIGPEQDARARQTDILRDEQTQDYFVEAMWGSKGKGPFSWLIGVSYFDESFDYARIITSRRATPAFGIQTAPIGFPNYGTSVKTKSTSFFITSGYEFSDQFSIEGGLRYSKEKKSLVYAQGILPSGTGDAALDAYFASILAGPYPTYSFNSKQSFEKWSPNITLSYKPAPNLNTYVSYSTGFRPGAFNLAPTTPETIPYGQETAENYEAGIKGSFLDGRLQASGAVFYMRQKDLLLAQTTSLGGVDRTYLNNVGTANTYGIEFEVSARPTDWLQLGGSVGWLDPKFDNAIANPGLPTEQDISGKLIPYTRRWTANLFAGVDAPVSDNLDFVASASLRYEQGGILGDYYVVDPYETMHKIDLSAGLVIDRKVRISAYVKNLADEHISQFWFYNRGTNTSEGRTFGLDISFKF
jgi:iron complex outermembrane receptor protein